MKDKDRISLLKLWLFIYVLFLCGMLLGLWIGYRNGNEMGIKKGYSRAVKDIQEDAIKYGVGRDNGSGFEWVTNNTSFISIDLDTFNKILDTYNELLNNS